MLSELFKATLETTYILVIASAITIILSLTINFLLIAKYEFIPKKLTYCMQKINNFYTYVPFFVIMLGLAPFANQLASNSNSQLMFALFPIIVFATPMLTCKIFFLFNKLPKDLVETYSFYNVKKSTLFTHVYLSECWGPLLEQIKTTCLKMLGYAAIAGFFGAGGLGELLYSKGYEEFNSNYILCIALAFIMLGTSLSLLKNKVATISLNR